MAAHPCTLNKAGFVRDGVFGQALRFDGQGRCVVSRKEFPSLVKGFTVESWLRLPTAKDKPRFGRVVSLPGCFSWQVNTYKRGRAKVDFSVETEAGRASMKTVEYVPCGIWVHVACTYDPGKPEEERLALYVNTLHTDQLTKYQARSAPKATLRSGKGDLVVGEGLVGDVDELRLSTPVRAPQELNGFWRSGVAGVFNVKAMKWKKPTASFDGAAVEHPLAFGCARRGRCRNGLPPVCGTGLRAANGSEAWTWWLLPTIRNSEAA